MALIMVPAPQVPQVVEECGRKGVAIVQILSGGFGESGDEGRRMENALKESARRWNMRIVGPNCIGTYSPADGIWLAVVAAEALALLVTVLFFVKLKDRYQYA